MTFKVLKSNLFLVQLHCLGDWSHVMEGSPRLFRGAAVVMEEYDGFRSPRVVVLDKVVVWAQVHKLL